MKKVEGINFKLIVSIVNRGDAQDVIEASKDAGAEGGTIIPARGSGIHETSKFFGLVIEPEKEIIFTLVNEVILENVIDSISEAIGIEKPNKGIIFVIDVPSVVGINHLIKDNK